MFKLSKKSWLLISVGVFTILFAGLWTVHSQQNNEHKQLADKLNMADLKLDGFQTEQLFQRQNELKEQLKQTLLQSEAARGILSQPIGSLAISSVLFSIAAAYNVEIIEIGSPGPGIEELDGLACNVLPLTATVAGDITDLVSFIIQLNDGLENSIINSVEISIPETTGEKASANFQMIVYAYQGG